MMGHMSTNIATEDFKSQAVFMYIWPYYQQTQICAFGQEGVHIMTALTLLL